MPKKKHTYTEESLDEEAARAEMCATAEIPGEQLRELIRLARVGFDYEQTMGFVPKEEG